MGAGNGVREPEPGGRAFLEGIGAEAGKRNLLKLPQGAGSQAREPEPVKKGTTPHYCLLINPCVLAYEQNIKVCLRNCIQS